MKKIRLSHLKINTNSELDIKSNGMIYSSDSLGKLNMGVNDFSRFSNSNTHHSNKKILNSIAKKVNSTSLLQESGNSNILSSLYSNNVPHKNVEEQRVNTEMNNNEQEEKSNLSIRNMVKGNKLKSQSKLTFYYI